MNIPLQQGHVTITNHTCRYCDVAPILEELNVWQFKHAACKVNGVDTGEISLPPNVEPKVWARTMWIVLLLNCNMVQNVVAKHTRVERSSVSKAKARHETYLQYEPRYRDRWNRLKELL